MNHLQKQIEYCLHIPPRLWHQFKQAMLNARNYNEEVIGFFFCQKQQINKRKIRYIPKSWVVPFPDCYEHQSSDGLILKQQFHQFLLEKQLGNQKLDIVHIHTHAGLHPPSFSTIDDRYESEYSQFLYRHFAYKPRLISGVFNSNLEEGIFRIWNHRGDFFQGVNFSNSYFELGKDNHEQNNMQNSIFAQNNNLIFDELPKENNYHISPQNNQEIETRFNRQKIFGNLVQKQLGELQVTLIGCGGIGSVFAEILGRLGVKKWTLIDSDRLEDVNLNRMIASTVQMVENNWYKVDYVKYLIKRIYPQNSHVKTVPHLLESEESRREIINSDLIVVATDNHYSRQLAQEIAIASMLPLICLGTHIDLKADGKPRLYARITIPPLGGNWCLMCGNIINLQKAALETASSQIHQLAHHAGYLEGVADPAVLWLNSICASTAVGIIHGMLGGFIDCHEGLDWICDFNTANWLKTNPHSLSNDNCYFCSADETETNLFINNNSVNNEDENCSW